MDRRSEIIYATMELAAENGLRSVSMQQIADKVGIRKASVYNHFASRDEIIEAMYSFLREKSKAGLSGADADLDKLFEGRTLREILMLTVGNYKKISTSPEMYAFYSIISGERSLDRAAAEIMVMETEKMINATAHLFRVLCEKGLADIENIDSAAYFFAMGVHSVIEHECDLAQIGRKDSEHTLESYIDEFCRVYEKRKE